MQVDNNGTFYTNRRTPEREREGGEDSLQQSSKEAKQSHANPGEIAILVVKSGDHIFATVSAAYLHWDISKMTSVDHNSLQGQKGFYERKSKMKDGEVRSKESD